jgi:hypothetical protein
LSAVPSAFRLTKLTSAPVGWELDLREHRAGGLGQVLQVGCGGAAGHLAMAVPVRVAEVLAQLRDTVQLARRNAVTHAVGLVVGEPQRAVLGGEVLAHRIARGAPSISVGRASALEATLSELAGGG